MRNPSQIVILHLGGNDDRNCVTCTRNIFLYFFLVFHLYLCAIVKRVHGVIRSIIAFFLRCKSTPQAICNIMCSVFPYEFWNNGNWGTLFVHILEWCNYDQFFPSCHIALVWDRCLHFYDVYQETFSCGFGYLPSIDVRWGYLYMPWSVKSFLLAV